MQPAQRFGSDRPLVKAMGSCLAPLLMKASEVQVQRLNRSRLCRTDPKLNAKTLQALPGVAQRVQ